MLTAASGGPVALVRDEATRGGPSEGARVLSLSSTGLTGLAASLQATLGVLVLDPLPVALPEAVRRVRFRP